MNDGILVVERNLSDLWKSLPLSDRKKLLNYKGYSGFSHWPQLEEWNNKNNFPIHKQGAFVSPKYIDAVNKYASALSGNIDILFILTDTINSSVPENFVFVGFDYGVIVDEYNEIVLFSILLNEVRPGGNPLFHPFLDKLNECYLLPDISSCEKLEQVRTKAFLEKKTDYLETALSTELCQPSKIFIQQFK